MQVLTPSENLYVETFMKLRELCRKANILPAACTLTRIVTAEGRHPLHQTAYSDVYRGTHNGTHVALKSLRLHGDDKAKVEKLR
jgi:hypothetical protein